LQRFHCGAIKPACQSLQQSNGLTCAERLSASDGCHFFTHNHGHHNIAACCPGTGITSEKPVNKRQFLSNSAKLAAAAALPLGAATPLLAQDSRYNIIKPPQATLNPDKIEVLEYFWFGCPHCYAFEPAINEWAADKPDDVDFVRHAPPLNPGWTPHSEAFYSAEVLGVTNKFFDEFFNAIHRERRPLRDRNSISKYIEELGVDVDKDKMMDTMKSFAVNAKIRQALKVASASRVNAVPTVVVNGKYLSTVSMAGGHKQIIDLINELVEKERAAA
jgi:thiol:disulfide interchange protein DsbA